MGKKITADDIKVTIIESDRDFCEIIEDCFKVYIENELAKIGDYSTSCSTIPDTAPMK